MPALPDSRAGRIAFTHPDFVLFEIARFLIVGAVEMQAVAVGWQVYDITQARAGSGFGGSGAISAGNFVVSGFGPCLGSL
jgi:hypothetical protein